MEEDRKILTIRKEQELIDDMLQEPVWHIALAEPGRTLYYKIATRLSLLEIKLLHKEFGYIITKEAEKAAPRTLTLKNPDGSEERVPVAREQGI